MDDLLSLSIKHREFYAPTFGIFVDGIDLMRELTVAVSQLEVDLQLGTVSRFAFTLPNSYNEEFGLFLTGDKDDVLEVLKFGAEIEVKMGYGDVSSAPTAMKGMITEISTSFPEGGSPELSVAGYDHGFPMTIGKSSRTWTDQPDSYAASEVTSFNNIDATIETLSERRPQIEQNQESDWEFLKKLAKRNDFELYVDEEKQLHFASAKDKDDPVVELKYGAGLLNFKPEANLAGQVSKVEVYGVDKNKNTIIGVATAGEESGLYGKSAGQVLNGFVRDPDKRPTLRLRQPVFTQAEADQRAEAALNERAKKFLTGEGESTGLPELRPDRKVKLTNLGRFSQAYYIQQAIHKIDGNGYRTRFKIKEPGAREKKEGE